MGRVEDMGVINQGKEDMKGKPLKNNAKCKNELVQKKAM
jgi:hypothetical protein